jgi:hypothetical protein
MNYQLNWVAVNITHAAVGVINIAYKNNLLI